MTENQSITSHSAASNEPDPATILLVDDDPINLNVLFQALDQELKIVKAISQAITDMLLTT